MKTTNFLWISMIVLIITSCSKTDSSYNPNANAEIQQSLQAMLDQTMKDYKVNYPDYPGGMAMKVVTKKGSWFVSSGIGNGITDGIHFRAASNTKTFTSTAILLLAQQGKLNINAKLTDLIPETQSSYVPLTPDYQIPFRDSITITQLLHHRAGVFDVSNDKIPDTISVQVPYKGMDYIPYIEEQDPTHTFTFDEMVGVAATCRLFYFAPGTSYHYSNTGYSILGKIIERVSGQSYQQFVMEHIVQPMGLASTTFPYLGTDLQIPVPFARGYVYMTDSIIETTESNISANVAEGNMITTPEDLSKFLRALIQGTGVLSPYWVNNVMLAPPPGSTPGSWYGCGINHALNLGYGHSGAHEGYLSRMVTNPEVDFTAVVFTNAWNMTNGMASIADQLYFLLDESCYRAKVIVQ